MAEHGINDCLLPYQLRHRYVFTELGRHIDVKVTSSRRSSAKVLNTAFSYLNNCYDKIHRSSYVQEQGRQSMPCSANIPMTIQTETSSTGTLNFPNK